ncbi:MAG: mobile mystery protein A, partial [Gammaproteobacteria bacterium]
MTKAEFARKHIDRRLAPLRAATLERPAQGWIRAIREGLGMTTAQLSARMGLSQPRVVAIEHAEAQGRINLRTLERAARALDCHLVYALVPKQSLDKIVRDRAMSVAAEQLRS